ncbi:MAG: FAD-dependent monooxygenase, partial [Leptospiraceae bacterium]|nr:FAD-dependent monooxygenase [Leptospiraceae bacterium]
SFDLLIGADGLHSHVRQILFKETPEKEMGACVAAFTAHDYRYKDDSAYVLYQSDKKQMARTTLADGRTMFLLTFRSELLPEGASIDDPRPLLRTIYEGSGWESETALQAMDDSDDLYFDRVSQIRLDHWSDGPVALIGDAAACASLLAGEGTGLAMIESYVLAGELYRADGDYSKAFRNYEERLSKFLRKKQNAARSMVAFFAPAGGFQRWLNRNLIRASSLPGASFLTGLFLDDDIELPDYLESGPVNISG